MEQDESCVQIAAADPCGAVKVLTRNWLCAGEITVTEQNAKQAREVSVQTHYWIAREQQSWAWRHSMAHNDCLHCVIYRMAGLPFMCLKLIYSCLSHTEIQSTV